MMIKIVTMHNRVSWFIHDIGYNVWIDLAWCFNTPPVLLAKGMIYYWLYRATWWPFQTNGCAWNDMSSNMCVPIATLTYVYLSWFFHDSCLRIYLLNHMNFFCPYCKADQIGRVHTQTPRTPDVRMVHHLHMGVFIRLPRVLEGVAYVW